MVQLVENLKLWNQKLAESSAGKEKTYIRWVSHFCWRTYGNGTEVWKAINDDLKIVRICNKKIIESYICRHQVPKPRRIRVLPNEDSCQLEAVYTSWTANIVASRHALPRGKMQVRIGWKTWRKHYESEDKNTLWSFGQRSFSKTV